RDGRGGAVAADGGPGRIRRGRRVRGPAGGGRQSARGCGTARPAGVESPADHEGGTDLSREPIERTASRESRLGGADGCDRAAVTQPPGSGDVASLGDEDDLYPSGEDDVQGVARVAL